MGGGGGKTPGLGNRDSIKEDMEEDAKETKTKTGEPTVLFVQL